MSPLNAWNEGSAKQAIVDFVAGATAPGSEAFIPIEERIAVFDVDGTVFVEKPTYGEVMIAMRRLCSLHQRDPQKYAGAIYTQACANNYDFFNTSEVYQALLQAFLGHSQRLYRAYVDRQLHELDHPRFNVPLIDLVYAPMQQLVAYLVSREFRVFMVSGSEQGFVRTIAADAFQLSIDRGLGYRVALDYQFADGVVDFIRQDQFLDPDPDACGKPEAMWEDFGGDPVMAFGNTMGDFDMLQFCASRRPYPTFSGIVVHDDPAREYAYHDKPLEQQAVELGWLRVSMKNDFGILFNSRTA